MGTQHPWLTSVKAGTPATEPPTRQRTDETKTPAALPSWLPRPASSDHALAGPAWQPLHGGRRTSRRRARRGGSGVSIRWRSRNKVRETEGFLGVGVDAAVRCRGSKKDETMVAGSLARSRLECVSNAAHTTPHTSLVEKKETSGLWVRFSPSTRFHPSFRFR
jgi:hypothetical protein